MSRYVSIFLDSLISTAQAQSSSSDNGYINAYDTVVSVQAN